jgi:hypothetical protein
MELENIQLTDQQLEEFYSSHLVLTGTTGKSAPEKKPSQIVSTGITGKNNKRFAWIVNEPDYPFLSDEDFQLLSDVITACKMNMDDIALVNLAHNKTEFAVLIDELQARFVIISTLAQNWLPVGADSYTLQQEEGYQLYITEDLRVLRNDKVKKSKLWLALKQMLGL